MSRKFMSIKRVVLPTLAIISLLVQQGSAIPPSYAQEMLSNSSYVTMELATTASASTSTGESPKRVEEFTDWETDLKSHWAVASGDIQMLIDQGGIKGIPNGDGTFRFEPNRPITVMEFTSLIFGIADKKGWEINCKDENNPNSQLANTRNEVVNLDLAGGIERRGWDWYITYCGERGLWGEKWFKQNKDKPLTRVRAAELIYNTQRNWHLVNNDDLDPTKTKYMQNNLNMSWRNCNLLEGVIPDFNSISRDMEREDEYKDKGTATGDLKFVVNCLCNGILQGDNTGAFHPDDSLTRAEACAIVNRLFEFTERLDTTKWRELGLFNGTTDEWIKASEEIKAKEAKEREEANKKASEAFREELEGKTREEREAMGGIFFD